MNRREGGCERSRAEFGCGSDITEHAVLVVVVARR